MSSLDLNEIIGTRKKKQEYWEEKFNVILLKCHKKIKLASKKLKTDVLYEIPVVAWGVPKYDIAKCTRWIVQQLIRNGFKITMASPNVIRISWAEHVPKDNTLSLSELIEPPQKLYIQHKKDLAALRAISLNNELKERNSQEYFYVNNNDIPQTRIQPLYVRPNYPTEPKQNALPPPSANRIADRPMPTREPTKIESVYLEPMKPRETILQEPKKKEKKKKFNFTFN